MNTFIEYDSIGFIGSIDMLKSYLLVKNATQYNLWCNKKHVDLLLRVKIEKN